MDKIKDRGFITTLSTLVSPHLTCSVNKKKVFSNHTISFWMIVCKPSPLILFSQMQIHLLLFSITVILLVKGYVGIMQCLIFDIPLEVFFHCVMLKLLLK